MLNIMTSAMAHDLGEAGGLHLCRTDEEDLLEGLRVNDPAAQAEFWQRYWPSVLAICRRVLTEPADAADVAVDVLTFFIFESASVLERPSAMGGYLRLMAVRRALRFRERQQRLIELSPDPAHEGSEQVSERAADLAWYRPILNHCLGALTPKAAAVIHLRFGSDMTHERIGGLVGGNKQYICRLVRQSVNLLRKCVEAATQPAEAPG